VITPTSDTQQYTTGTTDVLTTVCSSATVFTQGNKTYTVTEPTTLTITGKLQDARLKELKLMQTDCPCTYSHPVVTSESDVIQYTTPILTSTSDAIQYTTLVTDVLTTFLPSSTIFTWHNQTYTVTGSTTITITSECAQWNRP